MKCSVSFLPTLETFCHFCKIGLVYNYTYLLDMLQYRVQLQDLKVQLAVTTDAAKPFVSKSYILEGDDEVIVDAYQHLQAVSTAAAQQYFSNMKAVAKELTGGDNAKLNSILSQARHVWPQP